MNTETHWILDKLNEMYKTYQIILRNKELHHSNGSIIELDDMKLSSVVGSCEAIEYLYSKIMEEFDMRFDDHCNECTEKLGKPFDEVHHWLDEFAKTEGWTHRKHRHHKEGVDEAKKLFGEDAGKAAEMHVRLDCNGELPNKTDWESAEYWLNAA